MIDWLSRIAETTGIDKVLECVGAAAFNAALEWQARSFRWRSEGLAAACPLEGLVRRGLKILIAETN